uniref:Uncharacterized protein n=1 Tax=Daphnia magna TaxID=35525 RepID=A0A0P6G608_9CRUS
MSVGKRKKLVELHPLRSNCCFPFFLDDEVIRFSNNNPPPNPPRSNVHPIFQSTVLV